MTQTVTRHGRAVAACSDARLGNLLLGRGLNWIGRLYGAGFTVCRRCELRGRLAVIGDDDANVSHPHQSRGPIAPTMLPPSLIVDDSLLSHPLELIVTAKSDGAGIRR